MPTSDPMAKKASSPPELARLAPLMPQLALVLRRHGARAPAVLEDVAQLGERHIAVLVSLEMGGEATVSELAARLEMSTAHASLVVGELANASLVDREHDTADRRRVLVSLSETSAPAIREMRSQRAAPLREFLRGMTPEESAQFIDQLSRLIDILRAS